MRLCRSGIVAFPSFGSNHDGKVLTDFDGSIDTAYGVAIQPGDQKIVVVGNARSSSTGYLSFAIARYDIDGKLDIGFGLFGKVIKEMAAGGSSTAYGVAIQADGQIVVVGAAGANPRYFAVARFSGADGALDLSFHSTGMRLEDLDFVVNGVSGGMSEAYDVAIQSDQKNVVVGRVRNGANSKMVLVRFNTDGSWDTNFSGDGIVAKLIVTGAQAQAVAIQSDGKILATGYCTTLTATDQFALVRYTSIGNLDATFGTGGVATTAIGSISDRSQALAIQSDGKIVVAGYSDDGSKDQFALVR
jgi:uncharacterized delta-60 repeat protein